MYPSNEVVGKVKLSPTHKLPIGLNVGKVGSTTVIVVVEVLEQVGFGSVESTVIIYVPTAVGVYVTVAPEVVFKSVAGDQAKEPLPPEATKFIGLPTQTVAVAGVIATLL